MGLDPNGRIANWEEMEAQQEAAAPATPVEPAKPEEAKAEAEAPKAE